MSNIYVNYGASTSVFPGWLNYDASPTVRIQRIPLVGKRLVGLTGNGFLFPDMLLYGDIVKGLPLPDGQASGVYASHVLEHLSLADFRSALVNTLRIMKPGAIFRLIVPDLRERARRYLEQVDSADPDRAAEAASAFMAACDLGMVQPAGGLLQRIRRMLGFSAHLWMWDGPSMVRALAEAGFTEIRAARLGDCEDPKFGAVEQENRYFTNDIREVALEARKPV